MKKELLLVWRSMNNRCYNEKQKSYATYGGRGIFIVDAWRGKGGFDNFVRDMGERPQGSSIERIDNNGPYSPENCRWASKFDQAKNKRNNRWITANGQTKHLAEWARDLDCSPAAILYRLNSGMSEQEAVTKVVLDNPNAKLTYADACYIRDIYPEMTAQALANKFDVSKKTVLNVIHNKTFKSE